MRAAAPGTGRLTGETVRDDTIIRILRSKGIRQTELLSISMHTFPMGLLGSADSSSSYQRVLLGRATGGRNFRYHAPGTYSEERFTAGTRQPVVRGFRRSLGLMMSR